MYDTWLTRYLLIDRTYLIERPHSHNRSTFEEIFEDETLLSTPLRDISVNDTHYVKTLKNW